MSRGEGRWGDLGDLARGVQVEVERHGDSRGGEQRNDQMHRKQNSDYGSSSSSEVTEQSERISCTVRQRLRCSKFW